VTTFNRRDGKRSGVAAQSLFQDSLGRIWVSTAREFGHLESDRFIPVEGLPAGIVNSIAEDTAGNLWIANQRAGLFRLSSGNVVQQFSWDTLGYNDAAGPLAADPLRGGLWLGFEGVAYFSDGQVRTSYSAADGLGEGAVSSFAIRPRRNALGGHRRRAEPAERRTHRHSEEQQRTTLQRSV